MVPWVLVYGCNILGLFAGSVVAFYQMEGSLKSLGVVPLFWGTFILMGHILVMVRKDHWIERRRIHRARLPDGKI